MRCEITGRECPTLDEHHVIPREYGGIDGPTVNIDPAVHQAIHRYTHNPSKLATFLSAYPANVRGRIQMLVTAIKEAASTLERSRSCAVTIQLSEEEYDRLSTLAAEMATTEAKVAKSLLSKLLS